MVHKEAADIQKFLLKNQSVCDSREIEICSDQSNASCSENETPETLKHGITEQFSKLRKIIYGKKGLITFLHRLFLSTTHLDRQQFNFYFALKRHLEALDDYDEISVQCREYILNEDFKPV